jgi:preprotein translocase subunit SecG
MEKLQLSLLVFQVIVAVVMIILVLLQKSDSDSLSGIGGGGTGGNSVMSSKASASLISKVTMALAAIFMVNCLVLASLSNSGKKAIQKDLERIIEQQEKEGIVTKPSEPAAPKVQ